MVGRMTGSESYTRLQYLRVVQRQVSTCLRAAPSRKRRRANSLLGRGMILQLVDVDLQRPLMSAQST